MDFSYLQTIITQMEPLLTRVLPIVGTALILKWILNIIKK